MNDISRLNWKVAIIREFLQEYSIHSTNAEFEVMREALLRAAGEDTAGEVAIQQFTVPSNGKGLYACLMSLPDPSTISTVRLADLASFNYDHEAATWITAIKLIRLMTGDGLKECKDYFEQANRGEKVEVRVSTKFGALSWRSVNTAMDDLKLLGFVFSEH